uniref:Sin3a_C domain-containing protein n=1 Tax=Macrostomum lignano TaxID=282301 RepID=A0A1I8HNI6_9PLAT
DGEDPDVDSASAAAAPALIGNNNIYALLRLYQLLCKRLAAAKSACDAAAAAATSGDSTGSDSTAVALRLRQPPAVRPDRLYEHFMHQLVSLMDGAVDSAVFEDQVRELLGVQHYELFTLDKLVALAVRQLHIMATDDSAKQLLRLWSSFRATGGTKEEYKRRAERLMAESHHQSQQENLFRVAVDQESRQLTFQLMERQQPPPSPPPEPAPTQTTQPPRPPSEDPAPDVAASVEVAGSPPPERPESATAADCSVNNAYINNNYDATHRSPISRGGVSDDRAAPDSNEQLRIRQVFLVRNALQWIRLAKACRQDSANGEAEMPASAELPASSELPASADPSESVRQRVQWQRDIWSLLRATFGFQARTSELFQGVTYWDQMEIRGVSKRACVLMYATGCESVFYRSGQLACAKATHRAVTQAKRARLADWLARPTNRERLAGDAACRAWLLGQAAEDNRPGLRTSRIMLSPGSTGPPYHSYNRYRT